MAGPILHRAPWVVPVVRPPLADGAVLAAGGRIQAVGPWAELAAGFFGPVRDYPDQVLMPGLVNAHGHLELAGCTALGQGAPQPAATFVHWLRGLLAARAKVGVEGTDWVGLAQEAGRGMVARGIGLALDTGNALASAGLWQGQGGAGPFLLEVYGLGRQSKTAALQALAATIPASQPVTAHAPYSTAAELLVLVKERSRRLGHPFSIHLAESPEEVELLATGRGPMQDFLAERGFWDGSFVAPGCGGAEYLDRLDLLDRGTICVHGVQLTGREIDLLAQRRAGICLCPGSNRRLGVGKPRLAAMLAAGLAPALGTDSLASNDRLCLWREMALLRQDHPGVTPAQVLAMATENGARLLGQAGSWGSLAPGRRDRFLAVSCQAATAAELENRLTTALEGLPCQWVLPSPAEEDRPCGSAW
ncbi:MAG: amidohydrolase family protein [Thermodesulfobacteriota bacterium]